MPFRTGRAVVFAAAFRAVVFLVVVAVWRRVALRPGTDAHDEQTPPASATSATAELIRRTREAEASDPHGQRWKRGKATDAYCTAFDRTSCRVPGDA